MEENAVNAALYYFWIFRFRLDAQLRVNEHASSNPTPVLKRSNGCNVDWKFKYIVQHTKQSERTN